MLAWLVWWHALPVPVRRLLGAVVVLGAVVGGIALHEHRLKHRYFDKGYAVAVDSAREATVVREIALRDSAVRRADSLRARVDTVIVTKLLTQRPHFTVDTVPVAVRCDSIPLVGVTVESEHQTYYAEPQLAKLLVWQDSVIYKVMVPQIALRDSAYVAEHNAREHSDSAVALARNATALPPPSHRIRDAVFTALGVVAGFVAARHIR